MNDLVNNVETEVKEIYDEEEGTRMVENVNQVSARDQEL